MIFVGKILHSIFLAVLLNNRYVLIGWGKVGWMVGGGGEEKRWT